MQMSAWIWELTAIAQIFTVHLEMIPMIWIWIIFLSAQRQAVVDLCMVYLCVLFLASIYHRIHRYVVSQENVLQTTDC